MEGTVLTTSLQQTWTARYIEIFEKIEAAQAKYKNRVLKAKRLGNAAKKGEEPDKKKTKKTESK